MQYKRLFIKKLSLVTALSVGAVLYTAPAFAGFEWTPSEQNKENLPIVAPEVDSNPAYTAPARKMIIPSKQKSDPVYKVGASAEDLQDFQNSKIENKSQKKVLPSLFTPMPGDVSSQQRTTEEPVPLVVENMKYIQQGHNSSSSSMVNQKALSVSSSVPQGPIKINPYPVKRDKKTGAVDDGGQGTRPQAYLAPSRGGSSQSSYSRSSSAMPSVAPAPVVSVRNHYDNVAGFGADIPLIMAIQQVVPSDFTYSFASGVNLNGNVSWQGDRSWNLVLQDMLKSLGYRAQIQDHHITIQ